ncbi:type II secretion system protein GspL [Vibrio sp. JC009]|uniref:type II secretion system protein GspL n=1 Tax=Vibrio sp. JC009 TaxID=2912314 RepID=UPI0023B174BD|nr:type II secretion system protein GspL [Vibrio sp. JC009]WED21933.1 type II secretion system protein GspL [Vibrio sp. JC009]
MSEFLTVRLSRDKEKTVSWLVWSASQNEIIASGELAGHEQLEELAPYARQRTTIIIPDSGDIVLSEVELPAGASKQLDTVLPYLMEDDIAQDVESLHFHVMKKAGQKAYVAVVERQYIKSLLDKFSKLGIEVKKVVPDVLALPVKEKAISAVQIDDTWLLRKAVYSGLVIEQEWLPQFFASDWRKAEESVLPVHSYTPAPENSDSQQWQQQEPELVMELLAKGAIASSENLLSGEFKPQSSILKHLRVWKGAAVAACFLLVVALIQNVMQINQAEEQAKAYRAESERIFRAIFPDKRKIPTVSYLKRQMNDEERRLSGGGVGDSVFTWLMALPEALNKQGEVKFTSLRYDANRGEVRVEAKMKDFQTFEVVRKKLAETFVVTQGPLDREGDKVQGSFVLRREP